MLMLNLNQQTPDCLPPFIYCWDFKADTKQLGVEPSCVKLSGVVSSGLIGSLTASPKPRKSLLSRCEVNNSTCRICWLVIWPILTSNIPNKSGERDTKLKYTVSNAESFVLYVCVAFRDKRRYRVHTWEPSLLRLRTCLELLYHQSRRGKQVPSSRVVLEQEEVFWQLALWIWLPPGIQTRVLSVFVPHYENKLFPDCDSPICFLGDIIVPSE